MTDPAHRPTYFPSMPGGYLDHHLSRLTLPMYFLAVLAAYSLVVVVFGAIGWGLGLLYQLCFT